MSRALTIFCGKGGAGKTTISLAFALLHARRGRRVLVVTSHPLPELAATVSLAGLKESHPEAAANLFIVYIDPREVLRAQLQAGLPNTTLAGVLFSSRIYQSLVEVIPGLKEIAFLSHMRQLAERGSGSEAPAGFDLLVWDAPATGHFLRTLEVARNLDTYISGPFALLGKDLARFLADPSALVVFPVTILEDMAVEETIELCDKLAGLKMFPAALICNMTSPLLAAPDVDWDALRSDFSAHASGSPNPEFILERLAVERAMFAKLRLAITLPAHIVERQPAPASDVAMLLAIAHRLDPLDSRASS